MYIAINRIEIVVFDKILDVLVRSDIGHAMDRVLFYNGRWRHTAEVASSDWLFSVEIRILRRRSEWNPRRKIGGGGRRRRIRGGRIGVEFVDTPEWMREDFPHLSQSDLSLLRFFYWDPWIGFFGRVFYSIFLNLQRRYQIIGGNYDFGHGPIHNRRLEAWINEWYRWKKGLGFVCQAVLIFRQKKRSNRKRTKDGKNVVHYPDTLVVFWWICKSGISFTYI